MRGCHGLRVSALDPNSRDFDGRAFPRARTASARDQLRVELDAFIACGGRCRRRHRAMREHLEKHPGKPVTPFDLSSYSDVLKLAAGNSIAKAASVSHGDVKSPPCRAPRRD